MVERKMNVPNDEPEQKKFELPSENMEHLFQVVDILSEMSTDSYIVTKLEVADGDEMGRSLLHRVSLDPEWKGFFTTRLFLKAIGEEYKGEISINEDRWIGRRFFATVVHNVGNNGKTYANIDEYNFDKVPEVEVQENIPVPETSEEEVAWDDDK